MKIDHDFHIHTNLSLCANDDATVEYYIKRAEEIGLKKIGFANHFWDEKIEGANGFYEPQNLNHLLKLKEDLKKFESNNVKTFFGCEVEFHPKYGVALTEKTAQQFDFILVPNSHTHMTMDKNLCHPYEKHAKFMVEAYLKIINSDVSKYITAMAHPFEAVACPYDNQILMGLITDDQYKLIFSLTAKKNIAVEINTHAIKNTDKNDLEKNEQLRIYKIAKSCGCKFIFGSDSHDTTTHNEYIQKAELVASALNLKEKDLIII